MKIKHISLICLLACLLMLPVLAFAGPNQLYLGDDDVFSHFGHDYPVIGNGWSFDGDVLTLENCTIDTFLWGRNRIPGTGTGGEYTTEYYGLSFAGGDLTIKLVGDNTIRLTNPSMGFSAYNTYLYGIYAMQGDNLTIIGDGSLTIDLSNYVSNIAIGIDAGQLTIGNGSDLPRINVKSSDVLMAEMLGFGETTAAYVKGLTMNSGAAELASGKVEQTGTYTTSYGVTMKNVNQGIEVLGGSLIIKSAGSANKNDSCGIYFGRSGSGRMSLVYDCYVLVENEGGGLAYKNDRLYASSADFDNPVIPHRWRHGANDEWVSYSEEIFGSQREDSFNPYASRMEYVSAVTVTFSANGGTGAMAKQTVFYNDTITLPACGFTAPAGKQFKGWEIDGVTYAEGDSYTVTGATTVKALWEKASVIPATGDGANLALWSMLAVISLLGAMMIRRRMA